MSVQYPAVGWNSYKKRYDLILLAGLILYLTLFVGIGVTLFPYATAETLIIRALGTSAFFLLHVILCIGPLCRLNPRFLPLLYNRRHMGVTMFLLGLGHGVFSIFQFHALGNVNPLYSLLISNRDFASVADFPFQQLGFLALVILFLMAATSHDFWLRNLTPPAWKRLHLLAYASYALLTAHVTLGTLQSETSSTFAVVLALGFVTVISLHLAAAFKEKRLDETKLQAEKDGFLNACAVDRVPEKCATVVSVAGERIAIFRYDGKISALSNVCRHQNGPLGEGQIIDGCVTCPWHGYQYAPDSGASPPPFAEKVATFRIRVVDGRVWLDPKPNPPGTRVEPAAIAEGVSALSEFFVGYLPTIPPGIARMVRRAVMGILLGVVAATIILVASQHRFASAAFEYGKVRDFEGVIEEQPYPVLLVRRPGLVPVDNR